MYLENKVGWFCVLTIRQMLFKSQTDVNCKQDITANERELITCVY